MSIKSECLSRSSPVSDPTGDSSPDSSSIMYRNGRRLSKRQKLELKRMRNRQAAKKSRMLKKEHFVDLQHQNQILREKNQRLQRELEMLRMASTAKEMPNGAMVEQPVLFRSEEDLLNQRIINGLNEDLTRQKKTDDDINFERITESWHQHSLLPKLFMLVVVLCIAWLSSTGDNKKFTLSGVQCADLIVNSSSHSLCIDMQRRHCLRDQCQKLEADADQPEA